MSEQTFHNIQVFTTGSAAKACQISQQTIIRCFDQGRLKGFRIPGSNFRRIPRDHLISFMKEHGLDTRKVVRTIALGVGSKDAALLSVLKNLAAKGGLEYETPETPIDFVFRPKSFDWFLLDLRYEIGIRCLTSLEQSKVSPKSRIIIIGSGGTSPLRKLSPEYLSLPISSEALSQVIFS